MQKLDTEPRTSPGHTKDRKKAGAEEGRGDDEGSRGGPGPTARIIRGHPLVEGGTHEEGQCWPWSASIPGHGLGQTP